MDINILPNQFKWTENAFTLRLNSMNASVDYEYLSNMIFSTSFNRKRIFAHKKIYNFYLHYFFEFNGALLYFK